MFSSNHIEKWLESQAENHHKTIIKLAMEAILLRWELK